MSRARLLVSAEPASPETLFVEAVRRWCEALHRRQPALPFLYAWLEVRRAGLLAPAIDSLLSLQESWSGCRFHAAAPWAPDLTNDERWLLALMAEGRPPALDAVAKRSLSAPLRAAAHSTRILLQRSLGCSIDGTAPPSADRATLCAYAEVIEDEIIGPVLAIAL